MRPAVDRSPPHLTPTLIATKRARHRLSGKGPATNKNTHLDTTLTRLQVARWTTLPEILANSPCHLHSGPNNFKNNASTISGQSLSM